MNMELEFIQVDSDGIFRIFNHFLIPSNLIEITEEFVRVGEDSKNLTVRTVRYHALCYQLCTNLEAHAKTIIEKRILIVKPFEEAVDVEKESRLREI